MKIGFVFPGQGSQYVGMGQALAAHYETARDVFDEVNEALGQDLFAIMSEGPEDALKLTSNTQPALMATSLAVIRMLEQDHGIDLAKTVDRMAGHSLGEYSAYAAAGAFSVADTAKLLRTRGDAMQAAVPVGQGAMAAIIGLGYDDVQEIAHHGAGSDYVCEIANDNCNGQIVISGHAEAIDRAIRFAKEKGAKRALPLPVSAPFHCPLMTPAAERMRKALAVAEISMPKVPVYTNVTTDPAQKTTEIASLLVEQVTGQVRWRETMEKWSNDGIDMIVEIGAGKVLGGLVRRINKEITVMAVETPEQIDALVAALK